MFACNGILFNHESPRRGETFVTRKITRGIARIKAGKDKKIYLGNLKARRDWGFAPEYVQCQWRMLQEEKPDDFVLGTGESHTVEEFVREAFEYANLDWKEHVAVDTRYFRPTEVDNLCADVGKARRVLDWTPQVSFRELVKIMVDGDLKAEGLEVLGDGDVVLQKKGFQWMYLRKETLLATREGSSLLA